MFCPKRLVFSLLFVTMSIIAGPVVLAEGGESITPTPEQESFARGAVVVTPVPKQDVGGRGTKGESGTLAAGILQSEEVLIVKYADGPWAVTSEQSYSGSVHLTVSGIGQASGTQYTDAFYVLTDFDGNPTTPSHPTEQYNWVLSINGEHAENLIPGNQIPPFRSDNVYTFDTDAPGGFLSFGVNDLGTGDNTGFYIIRINSSLSTQVPFFWQEDPNWATHPLRTNGECSAYCSTIGHCGCTLTSATMLFAYYGADLRPPDLSDDMGKSACLFRYSVAADHSSGKAMWIGAYDYTEPGDSIYPRLDFELNEKKRMPILGMHKRDDKSKTHFVLVTSGQGGDPSNYLVHDPGVANGADTNLSVVLSRQDAVPARLRVYDRLPASARQVEVHPERIMDSAVDLDAGVANTSTVTGEVVVYHMTEPAVIVQIAASSTAGAVTEMLIWTDSHADQAWQPFGEFGWIPWEPGDKVYARFRDEFGNESETASDSTFEEYGPPPEEPITMIPPLVDVGGPYTGTVGEAITLDGSGSSDPDGKIVLYEWDFGSDGVFDLDSTAPTTTHVYSSPYSGLVTLRVTDIDGTTATDAASVEVQAPNLPPIVDAGGPYTGTVGEAITLDGSGSSDPDGKIILYEWDFEDDSRFDFDSTEPAAAHIYSSPFSGVAKLRVTDDDGTTATDAASVEVQAPKLPPTCYALTLGITGQGSDPVASPQNSAGCSAGRYVAGESISLSGAIPDKGWRISGWTGTTNNASTANTNTVTMPASTHATGVIFTRERWFSYLPALRR